MEIPAWLYFSFWSITGSVSLFLGMKTLDKTDLPTSVSPSVMSIFKYSLAISTCHSSNYSLMLRPKLNISPEKYSMWMFFAIFPLLFNRILELTAPFAWYFPVYSFINLFGVFYFFLPEMKSFIADEYISNVMCPAFALFPLVYFLGRAEAGLWYFFIYGSNFLLFFSSGLAVVDEEHDGLYVHFFVSSSMFFIGGIETFSPVLILFVSFLGSGLWAAFAGDERFRKWVPRPVQGNGFLRKLKEMVAKRGRLIEFGFGMMGTILFQNFFKLTSFDHVVAFLYFAVLWLSNVGLLMNGYDFGIFNFLLTNVIVGCTVSEFGLRGTTWIAFGAAVLLYGLRLKLESLALVRKENGKDVIVWRELEM